MIKNYNYKIEYFVDKKNSIKTMNKYNFVSNFKSRVDVFILIMII